MNESGEECVVCLQLQKEYLQLTGQYIDEIARIQRDIAVLPTKVYRRARDRADAAQRRSNEVKRVYEQHLLAEHSRGRAG